MNAVNERKDINRTQLLLVVILTAVLIDIVVRLITPPPAPPNNTVGLALPEGISIGDAKKCASAEECGRQLEKAGFTGGDTVTQSVSTQTFEKPSNSVYCAYVIDAGGEHFIVPDPPKYYPNRKKCPNGMKKVPGG